MKKIILFNHMAKESITIMTGTTKANFPTNGGPWNRIYLCLNKNELQLIESEVRLKRFGILTVWYFNCNLDGYHCVSF